MAFVLQQTIMVKQLVQPCVPEASSDLMSFKLVLCSQEDCTKLPAVVATVYTLYVEHHAAASQLIAL